MYDELVNSLRICGKILSADDYCVAFHDGCCEAEPVCMYELMMKAADAIAELQQIAAHYEETAKDYFNDVCYYLERMPKWIPVTERLPKEGEFVLVCGNLYPNKHDGGVIAVSKRMDWNYWQGFGRERNITHWMPLPPAPKEGE